MGNWNERPDERSEQIQRLVRLELDGIAAKLLERANKYQEAAQREKNERAFVAMNATALALVEFHAALTGGELDDP